MTALEAPVEVPGPPRSVVKPLLGAVVAAALIASAIDRAARLNNPTAQGTLGPLLLRVAALELALLLAALFATRPASCWKAELRLGPGGGGLIAIGGVLLSLLIAGFAALVSAAVGLVRMGFTERASAGLALVAPGQVAWVVVVLGLMPSIGEEIFFRGFMQTELAKRMSRRRALVLSSLTFALLHLDPRQLVASLPLGLWWGHLSDRTGSIRPAIAAHAACNVVATVAALAMTTG
jgi:uncharacterized protein